MSDICTDNRFELIEKYKNELIEATNISGSPDEMSVIDSILFRFWQMGWLDTLERMPLVKESARTLMHSAGDTIASKAMRNAGRFIQSAIDGQYYDFEQIEPEPHNGKWIDNGNDTISCSRCATWFPKEREPFMHCCPYCFADMRGEEE